MFEESALRGLNLLVVEDAFLVAVDICAQLEARGCKITGPVSRLGPAIELARTEPISGAVLDVNLAGELSFPIAAALGARHVPYVFLTGYDDDTIFPREFRGVPRLGKPFRNRDLVDIIVENIIEDRRYLLAANAPVGTP
jgi:DNA-binding response OmpR family regulator